MSTRSQAPLIDDTYCQLCSSSTSDRANKRLSSFSCEHCHLSLCYRCFEKHSAMLPDYQAQPTAKALYDKKRQLLANFQEHCLRNLQSTFDEVFQDLENLRRDSMAYVKQQFHDAEIVLEDIASNSIKDDPNKKLLLELEQRLEIFASPRMQLKMFTFPRNKLDLHCQLFNNTYAPTKKFSSSHRGKFISTRCTCAQSTEFESEKMDVETEIEELNATTLSSKPTQTDSDWLLNFNTKEHVEAVNGEDSEDDDDDYFSVQGDGNELGPRLSSESRISSRYISQHGISTEHEVDRLASDGEHLLYFSDTSKSLCYVTKILHDRLSNQHSTTKEIVCRWPHYPILDLIYSPASSQFICATKTGIYTCIIDSNDHHSTIDIQIQITEHWSYVRLSADKNYLWVWTDTPSSSQLRIYSPHTFQCLKNFDLYDYPRFSDNSTSFCTYTDRLATVFQFKQPLATDSTPTKKYFQVTFCDRTDLHELSTVRLGECDIDHEIRASQDGMFFLTNGKRKLWILEATGRTEFVKLASNGRALAVHTANEILIANGTRQLQCIVRG